MIPSGNPSVDLVCVDDDSDVFFWSCVFFLFLLFLVLAGPALDWFSCWCDDRHRRRPLTCPELPGVSPDVRAATARALRLVADGRAAGLGPLEEHVRYSGDNYSGVGFCWVGLFDGRDQVAMKTRSSVQSYQDVLRLGADLYTGVRFDQFVADSVALAMAHSPESIELNLGIHSAFDTAFDRYTSPANIQAMETDSFPHVAEAMQRIRTIAPWHFSGASKAKAVELAIPTSDFFPEPHSHPVHAALRRMELCEVIPKYVRTKALCVSMSDANFSMLETRCDHPLRLSNPMMELKDLGRYSSGSISERVFSVPKFEEETLVCLDSGHYQTPENMVAMFTENPTLRFVILTHVYPLAALQSNRSPEPLIATWTRDGDDMVYVPEGDAGGAYRQPWSNPLLLAHRLSNWDGSCELSCGVVWSKLHSHVQIISRYPLSSLRCIALKADAFMPMPAVFDKAVPCGLIPVKYYTRLVDYGRAVQVRDRDLYGKIRQQVNSGEFSLNIVEKDILVAVVVAVLTGFKLDLLPTTLHATLAGYLNHRFLAGPVKRFFHGLIWGKLNARNARIVAEPNELQIIPTCKLLVRARAGALIGYSCTFENEGPKMTTWSKMEELVADQGFGKFVLPPQNLKWRFALGTKRFRDMTVADFRRVVLEDTIAEAAQLSMLDPDRAKVLLDNARAEMADFHEEIARKARASTMAVAKAVTWPVVKTAECLKSGDFNCSRAQKSKIPVRLRLSYLAGDSERDILWQAKRTPLPEIGDDEIDPAGFPLPVSRPLSRSPSVASSLRTVSVSSDDTIMPLPRKQAFVKPAVTVIRKKVEPVMSGALVVAKKPTLASTLADASRGEDQLDQEDLRRRWRDVKATGLIKSRMWSAGTSIELRWNEIFPKSCNRRWQPAPYAVMVMPHDLEYPLNDCLVEAVHKLTGIHKLSLMATIASAWPTRRERNVEAGLPEEVLHALGARYELNIRVSEHGGATRRYGLKDDSSQVLVLVKDGDHIAPREIQQRGIVIRPHPKTAGRREAIVQAFSSLPIIKWRQWVPGTSRAEKYVREMVRGATGTIHKYAINEQALMGWEEGIAKLSRHNPIVRQIAVVEGDPGCRKSSAIQKICVKPKFKRDNNYQIAVQTAVLNQDWKDKIRAQEKINNRGLPDAYCCTYEKALAKGFPCKVFITDEDKMPPGYMELKAYLSPTTSHFIRLGDRFQARWHDPNGDCLLNGDTSEGEFFSEWADYYIQGTWRFGGDWANFFRMPTFAAVDTKVFLAEMIPTTGAQLSLFLRDKRLDECNALHDVALTLYPSDAQVRAATALTAADVVSHSGSQGRGEDLVYVVLDETALKAEDLRTLYACLTRVKKYMVIGLTYNRSSENLAREASHPLFSRLRTLFGNTPTYQPIRVRGQDTIDIKAEMGGFGRPVRQVLAGPHSKVKNRAFLDSIGYEWPVDCLDPDGPEVVGRSEYYRQPNRDDPGYRDNAQVRVYLDQPKERRLVEENTPEAALVGHKVATHLPIESRRQWVESQVSQCPDRFDAELIYKGEYSDQFPDRWMFRHDAPDLRKKITKGILNRDERRAMTEKLKAVEADNPLLYKPYMSWCGQDQKPQDHVSFMRGVKERLKRSTFEHNEKIYKNGTSVYGVALFEAVKRAFNLRESGYAWDHLKFERCIAEFGERRSHRSEALKAMSLPRSEPEFRQFITAKRQMKVKPEIPQAGKPLQTLMIHCDFYLYALGPINSYMTDFFLEHCPENMYMHVKKTFADFDAFAAKMMRTATDPWEGDGKHFETSLDHNATYMFEQLMRLAGVPEYYIGVFLDYKMHAVSQLMIHFFMTMSGEAFTWLINTIKNIAETHCRFSVPKHAYQIYGGDDESHTMRYPVNPNWHVWKNYETCELKQTYTKTPRSFSYYLTKHGAVKDPVHLFRKLLIAEERGKLEDVIAGYAIEARSLFIKGDLVYDILPEEAVAAWQLLNSELFNVMKRTKLDLGTIKDIQLKFVRPLVPTSVKHWALGFIADINTEYTSISPNSPLSREIQTNFPILTSHILHHEEVDQVL